MFFQTDVGMVMVARGEGRRNGDALPLAKLDAFLFQIISQQHSRLSSQTENDSFFLDKRKRNVDSNVTFESLPPVSVKRTGTGWDQS